MNPTTTLLIVEDDERIRNYMKTILTTCDYAVLETGNARTALSIIASHSPDLVLLDLGLPDGDGIDMLRSIREWSQVPVIVVSARGHEKDKVAALDGGADDYVTKPFSPREVIARVKTVLRRMREFHEESRDTLLTVGNLTIDMSAFVVRLDKETIPCTPKEIEILWTLASNPGMVFSREHLLQSIWGYDFLGDTRAVDSHIKRIRAKLCKPTNNWDIRTVWGVGYRFETLS